MSGGEGDLDGVAGCGEVAVYRLRAVLAGISPLIWRRFEVPADLTVAALHEVLQASLGWSGKHLHRFTIAGADYGIWYPGGMTFRDDPYRTRLDSLGLCERERFSYEYNFNAPWQVDLRVEQIGDALPGRMYPRCTGGRRAGPPEDWDGPWDFLQRSRPGRVLDAVERVADIVEAVLNAKDGEPLDDITGPEGRAALLELLSLEKFDRRACNKTLRAIDRDGEWSER